MKEVWREFSRQAKVIRLPMWPKCPTCGSELRRTPQGWYCADVCHLYYNVERGKAGSPLLGPIEVGPPAKVEEEYDETIRDAFMRHLQGAGWTQDMYNKLSEHGKQLLFERFKATAGF